MLKPYEVLERAADVMDERGHAKDTYIADDGRVCVMGAIALACGAQPYWDDIHAANSGYALNEPRSALRKHLPDSPDFWNDAPERTKDEVTSTLRAIAATLRAQDGASLGVRQHVAESTVVADSHDDAAVMPDIEAAMNENRAAIAKEGIREA